MGFPTDLIFFDEEKKVALRTYSRLYTQDGGAITTAGSNVTTVYE
jgi:hypothetical protein